MPGRAEALADTSTFIAIEQGRPLRTMPPATLAVSYVTVAELTLGVLHAPSPAERARRRRTLLRVRGLTAADGWAGGCRLGRPARRAARREAADAGERDSWIAATAIAHGLPVVTQDDDYADVPGLDVILL